MVPNLYPGTRTTIVLKRPKTKGSIRLAEIPTSILQALSTLKEMQEQLKTDLGPTGYIDYNLVICQANGRPLMTEHLNKRFKDILSEMNDPDINPEEIVFHSLRHTSASSRIRPKPAKRARAKPKQDTPSKPATPFFPVPDLPESGDDYQIFLTDKDSIMS